MIGNLTDVLELDRIGVKVVSVRESWLDTGGPVRNLLIAIFSWCAEQERNRLVERTKAGLASARRAVFVSAVLLLDSIAITFSISKARGCR